MFNFDRNDIRLTLNLIRMNVRDRYLGSSLGSFWAITNPLFMLAVYTYVFGFILKVKLPGAESTFAYVIWLISGYGPWIATVEAIVAATASVVGASGLVKNMAFKTELLPISAAFIGLISLTVSLLFLLTLMTIAGNVPDWHIVWIPLIIILQLFFIVALGLWLSVINVFVRDLSIALPNILTIIMFITPIFYPISTMPQVIRILSLGNPFYQISDAYRNVLLEQITPNYWGMGYVFLLSVVIFHFGLIAFRRAKSHFDAAL